MQYIDLDAERYEPSIDAVLLCGGKGTRLQELTGDTIPKSLFEVDGRALIDYSLDAIDTPIVNQAIFAVDHLAGQMRDWASTNVDLPYRHTFSTQLTPGITGAVDSALRHVDADRVALCNTDEIRTGFMVDELLEAHHRIGAWATMLAARSTDLYRHRVLDINEDMVVGSVLKGEQYRSDPGAEGSVNTGFIIFEREALERIDLTVPGDWGSIIDPLIRSRKMGVFLIDQLKYFNVGTCEEFIEAEHYVTSQSATV